MDDGQKLPNIVSPMNRTKEEELLSCGKVNALILHRTEVATTCRIDSHGIGLHLGREGKDGVVAPRGRVDKRTICNEVSELLHAFGHLDA